MDSSTVNKQEMKDLLYWLRDQLEEESVEVQCEGKSGMFVPRQAICGRIYRLQKALDNDDLRKFLLEDYEDET